MKEEVIKLFRATYGSSPDHLAFAPGRIEFIGNHTDYNAGLVMGVAVSEGITVAVSSRVDRVIQFVSNRGSMIRLHMDRLVPLTGERSWTNYPAGVTKVMIDNGVRMDHGFNIAVGSNLPAGAGMSSSAALELATAKALTAVYDFELSPTELARIGRKAENDFVGMPCGILDQGVSAHGKADHLVRIDCASETFSRTKMPAGAHFWIFNSNKKHALVDSAYSDRFAECQHALVQLQTRHQKINSLSEVSLKQLADFESEMDPLLFKRASHIIGENARVRAVEAALAKGDLDAVGKELNASHQSSKENFENSIEELDTLQQAIIEQPNVYGARLTGGGFGGAVMALTNDAFGSDEVEAIKSKYSDTHGMNATVFATRSGDGARIV